MGAIDSLRISLRTSIKTLSARIDSVGGVISYGILGTAALASVWAVATMVIPNVGLKSQAEERLSVLNEQIEVQKANAQRLDDEIRALDSPYHVAIIAKKLGFTPIDPASSPVVQGPDKPKPSASTKRSSKPKPN